MRRQALVTPLFLALAVACRADSIDSQLDDYFNKAISDHRSPSFSVAVVTNGKVTYSKGFGFADIENEVPSAPQTVYRIGSITKQFTATMIMQLVQEGKLKLDDPYRKTLPETPEAWSKITVRQLLNHTSGLKNYTEVKGLFEDAVMKPVTPAGNH